MKLLSKAKEFFTSMKFLKTQKKEQKLRLKKDTTFIIIERIMNNYFRLLIESRNSDAFFDPFNIY